MQSDTKDEEGNNKKGKQHQNVKIQGNYILRLLSYKDRMQKFLENYQL